MQQAATCRTTFGRHAGVSCVWERFLQTETMHQQNRTSDTKIRHQLLFFELASVTGRESQLVGRCTLWKLDWNVSNALDSAPPQNVLQGTYANLSYLLRRPTVAKPGMLSTRSHITFMFRYLQRRNALCPSRNPTFDTTATDAAISVECIEDAEPMCKRQTLKIRRLCRRD